MKEGMWEKEKEELQPNFGGDRREEGGSENSLEKKETKVEDDEEQRKFEWIKIFFYLNPHTETSLQAIEVWMYEWLEYFLNTPSKNNQKQNKTAKQDKAETTKKQEKNRKRTGKE